MKARPIRCLVSAGPTREFFDPVRFVTNPSSGKMGYALAAAAQQIGWEVDLVSGPVALPAPEGVRVHPVVTGADMFEAMDARFDACDVLVMTAAIVDFKPRAQADHKIKKHELEMVIEMDPVVDVLATISKRKQHQLILGFAAETNNLEEYALRKLKQKNADWIAANQIGGPDSAFEKDSNTLYLFGKAGEKLQLGPAPKVKIAARLIEFLREDLRRFGKTKA